METKTGRNKFIEEFTGLKGTPKQEEALKVALDIRKFELDLYWKRASYFWILVAATFLGYTSIIQSDRISDVDRVVLTLVISCIGFILSFAWFLVNRGSKCWSRKWERNLDLLEDEVIGPLYKIQHENLDENDWLKNIFKIPLDFSVSKINEISSLFISIIWAFLLIKSLFPGATSAILTSIYVAIIIIITVFAIFALIIKGRTIFPDEEKEVKYTIRKYKD
jgi:hypothetical protein